MNTGFVGHQQVPDKATFQVAFVKNMLVFNVLQRSPFAARKVTFQVIKCDTWKYETSHFRTSRNKSGNISKNV